MRFARILALLLVVATLGITAYLFYRMPFAWLHLLPANIGALGSVYFWRKPPKRKKARKAAALASLMVVPFVGASAVAKRSSSVVVPIRIAGASGPPAESWRWM